jgi:hypothetical protein
MARPIINGVGRHLPENTIRNRVFDEDGNFIYTADIAQDIAAGNVAGTTFVDKFGETGENIDSADGLVDVWSGVANANCNKTYTYSTTADIDSISSSSASDTQDINVQGLDSNWDLVSQTVTLTGQTRKALTTPLIRIFRMYNDNGTPLVGTVYCYVNTTISGGVPTTPGPIRAIIDISEEQTLMALYTIPNGKTGFLVSGDIGLYSKLAGYSHGHFAIRKFGKVFRTQRTFGLSTTGTTSRQFDFRIPLPIPAKTDIRVRADSSANDMGIFAAFQIILVDD